MGKEWSEQHLRELIKEIMITEGGGGGSTDDPDDPSVNSDYNYPVLIQPGLLRNTSRGEILYLANDAISDSNSGSVFFIISGAVAAQADKIPTGDFPLGDLYSVLPIGSPYSIVNIKNGLRKIKPTVPSKVSGGSTGALGIVTGTRLSGNGDNAVYYLVRVDDVYSISADITKILNRLSSDRSTATGNYYYLSYQSSTSVTYPTFYLIGSNTILAIDGLIGTRSERLTSNISYLGEVSYLSSFTCRESNVSAFVTALENYITDEGIGFDYGYVTISDLTISDISLQQSSGRAVKRATVNEILSH